MDNSDQKCMKGGETPDSQKASGRLLPGMELTCYCGFKTRSKYLPAIKTYVADAVHV